MIRITKAAMRPEKATLIQTAFPTRPAARPTRTYIPASRIKPIPNSVAYYSPSSRLSSPTRHA
ncbi:MAG: hypothetical protein QXR56_07255, partial [Thermofilaceae archaeon]